MNKPKRKRFVLGERQKNRILFLFRKHDNTLTEIAEAVEVPLYHVHKVVDNHLKPKK